MPSITETSAMAFNPLYKEQFLFDCGHLLQFCEQLSNSSDEEPNESILEVKIKELDSRWARLNTTYQKVMLS